MRASPAIPCDLDGREVVVGVGGGIAAYKVVQVVSTLVQRGCGVRVCMTPAATKFVTPLTFESVSGRPALTDPWSLEDPADPQHLAIAERADLLLIAPATADLLARCAHGLCDDLVTLLVLAATSPVLFAPSMNTRMWQNPATVANVERLRSYGHDVVGPEDGWLACRNVGPGRLSEPEAIVERVVSVLSLPNA